MQIKDSMKNNDQSNFIINQSVGLGKYMITGEAGDGQLSNSYIILGLSNLEPDLKKIRSINSEDNIYSKKRRALIDRLAVLEAVKNNDSKVNKATYDLIKKYPEEMISVMKQDRMTQSIYKSFEEKRNQWDIQHVKGQRDKVATNYITDRVGSKSQADELAKENYLPSEGLTYGDDYDVYLNTDFTEPGWSPEGLIMTNDGQKIFSYINILKEDMVDIENAFDEKDNKKQQLKIRKELEKKNNDVQYALSQYQDENYVSKTNIMRPVFSIGTDNKIFVTDMDISVNKRKLENQIKTRNRFESVMSKSYSRGIGIKYAKDANMKILDALEEDMNENYLDDRDYFAGGKKNLMTYIKIGPYENNRINKEKWPILPRYLKVNIMKRHDNNVRREYKNIAEDLTGTKDIDFNDIYTKEIIIKEQELNDMYRDPHLDVDKIVPKQKELGELFKSNLDSYIKKHKKDINNKTIKEITNRMTNIQKTSPYIAVRRNMVDHTFGRREPSVFSHSSIRNTNKIVKVLKYIGALWKHIVKMVKSNIVIRDLPVLMWNITSNVLLAVIQGRNPIKEVQQQIKGIILLNKYRNASKRMSELAIKSRSGLMTKSEKDEYNRLQNEINNNPVKPLIDAGLYSHAAEDLSNDDIYKQDYFDAKVDAWKGKMPKGVQSVLEYGFLMKKNPVFNTLLTFMQSSDFAARYSKYYTLIEQGVDPQTALKEILDNQINYNFRHGKILQWLNANGIVMFSMFLEKIQKVIKKTTFENPFNVLLAILAGGTMVDDSPLGDFMTGSTISNRIFTPFDLMGNLGEWPAAIQIATGDYHS